MDVLITDRERRDTKKTRSVRYSESARASLLVSKGHQGDTPEVNSQSQVTLNDSASGGKDRTAAVYPPDLIKLTSSSSLCKREIADDLMSLEAVHKTPLDELKKSLHREETSTTQNNIGINYSRVSTRFSAQVPTNPLTNSLSQLDGRNSFSMPICQNTIDTDEKN